MKYVPGTLPEGVGDPELLNFLREELQAIQDAISMLAQGRAAILYAEPPKPRTGMVVYADGTEWNPGNGEGVYSYSSLGTWTGMGFFASLKGATLTLTAATPTVAAGQMGLGTTTSTSATAGVSGALPATVQGYLTINLQGSNRKIPYYLP